MPLERKRYLQVIVPNVLSLQKENASSGDYVVKYLCRGIFGAFAYNLIGDYKYLPTTPIARREGQGRTQIWNALFLIHRGRKICYRVYWGLHRMFPKFIGYFYETFMCHFCHFQISSDCQEQIYSATATTGSMSTPNLIRQFMHCVTASKMSYGQISDEWIQGLWMPNSIIAHITIFSW